MKSAGYNIWQALELCLRLSARANEEVRLLAARATAGAPGPKGDPGPPGAPGMLAEVKPWSQGIHYAGVIVTHAGATWQAKRDTAQTPTHDDWAQIAAAGRDAPIGTVHGLYDQTVSYRMFDLVVFNGSEWRAKRDEPGPLPGDGWALAAQVGRAGKPGERGASGPAGPPGPPGIKIAAWEIKDYTVIPVLTDGTLGPALDLAGILERYHHESVR